MKFLSLITILFFSLNTWAQDLGLGASSLKLQVYKVAVSTSPFCTSLITIVDNGATPTEEEFVGGISVGSGTVPAGTYECVVIEFSDNIKFTPDANSTSTNCNTAVEETLDVCQAGSAKLIDGSTSSCNGTANKVAMYLSTTSTQTTGVDAFNPPQSVNDSSYGFNLGSSLTVSSTSTSGTFVVNPAGKVCDDNTAGCDGGGGGGSSCKMEPPLFSFSQ